MMAGLRWISVLPITAALLGACATAPTAPPTVAATAAGTPVTLEFVGPEALPTSAFDDPVLREAEANYQVYCAHCHGYAGEGQLVGAPAETERLGMKPVPPHDATGDTWRYADPMLYAVIRDGVQNPLNQYPMVGWGGVLTDAQIMGLIAYMRLWWTDEQRAHQAEVTQNLTAAREESGLPVFPPRPTPVPVNTSPGG
jgi:mono/diheme cytochrome c family protein